MPFDAANFVDAIPAPVTETEPQRVIREARSLIERGWAKGSEHTTERRFCFAYATPTLVKSERYCMIGALRAASKSYGSMIVPGARFVEAALPAFAEGSIPTFNDHRNTSKRHVLAVMNKAYALAAR